MRVPKSFDDFTVGQFMAWHEILKRDFVDPEDREFELLSLLTDKPVSYFENLPHKEVLPMIRDVNALQFTTPSKKINRVVKINGKFYIPVIRPSDLRDLMSASQYTAFKEYTKTDAVEHMDKILAILYTPFKLFGKKKICEKQEWLANEFRSAKIGDVYGFIFFLEMQYQELIKTSLPYFQSASQTIENHMKDLSLGLGADLSKDMAGIT